MSEQYDDIICLFHPTSSKHPRMAAADRAAQFSPFAALTGYADALRETARSTGTKAELDEDALAALDRKLRFLSDRIAERPVVSITYFKPDIKKAGGAYETITGIIKKIDTLERTVVLTDASVIPISDIFSIESSVFPSFDEEGTSPFK